MNINHENPFELENIDWAQNLEHPDLVTIFRTKNDKLLDAKNRRRDGLCFIQFELEAEQELNF